MRQLNFSRCSGSAARTELLSKKTKGVSVLLAAIQATPDEAILENICAIFACAVHGQEKKLAKKELGSQLSKVVVALGRGDSIHLHDTAFSNLYCALAVAGRHEKRFPLTFRLSGALATTLRFIDSRLDNAEAVLPALEVLVVASNSDASAALAGKHGGVELALGLVRLYHETRDAEVLALALRFTSHLMLNSKNLKVGPSFAIGPHNISACDQGWRDWSASEGV